MSKMMEAETRGVPESLLEEEQAKSPEFDDADKIWFFSKPTARKSNRAPHCFRRQIPCETRSSSQAA